VDFTVDGSVTGPLMCAPCFDADGNLNGVLQAIRVGNDKHFTTPDGDFLRRLGVLVGVSLQNCPEFTWLHQSHDLSGRLLATQHNLAKSMRHEQKPELLPLMVIREAAALFQVPAVVFFRYDANQHILFRYAIDPDNREQLAAVCSCPPWGIVGETITGNTRMINEVTEYRKKGSIHEVFEPDIDCPTTLCEARAVLSSPIMAAAQEGDGQVPIAGAVSLILDTSSPRRFTPGEQHCLQLLCSYVTSLMFADQSAQDALIPSKEELESMLQVADLDGSDTLNSEDELFLMTKQLCMKCAIRNATRELVWEHALKADKVCKEWAMPDYVKWFMQTKDKHYAAKK